MGETDKLKRSLWMLAPLAVMAVLWLLFWWPAVLGERVFYIRDLTFYALPMKTFMMERFSAGEFPFWTPRLSCGMPFFAEPSHQVLYLANLVFFLAPTVPHGINAYVLIHLLFAPMAMFFLCRVLGVSRPVALWAGVAYGFSGYVVSISDNINYLPAVVWLPVSAACFIRGLMQPDHRLMLRWSLLGTLSLSMMIFAGDAFHPTFFGVFCVLLLALRWKWPDIYPGVSFKLSWLHLVATFGTIGLVTAVQLLPTWELLQLSVRQQPLSYEETTLWSFPPQRLIEFLLPFFYGSKYDTFNYTGPHFVGMFLYPKFREPWADSVYIGVIPVIFAIVAAIRQPGRAVFWIVMIAGSLILAFGSFIDSLYQQLVTFIPPLSSHRYLEKFVFFATVDIFALAAIGADDWLARPPNPAGWLARFRRLKNPLTAKVMLTAAWAFGSLLVLVYIPVQLWILPHAMERSVEWGPHFYDRLNHVMGLAYHWIAVSFLVSLILWVPPKYLKRYLIFLLIAGAVDLFGIHFRHTPLAPAELLTRRPDPVPVEAIRESGTVRESTPADHIRIFYDDSVDYPEGKTYEPILARIAEAHDRKKITDNFKHYWIYRVLYNQQRLLFNYGLLYGLNYHNGRFAPLQPKNHKLMDVVMARYAPRRFLELAGVDYVLTPIRIYNSAKYGAGFWGFQDDVYVDNPNWAGPEVQVAEKNRGLNLQVVKLENAVPRAYLSPNIVFNPEPMRVYKIITDRFRENDPRLLAELHVPPPPGYEPPEELISLQKADMQIITDQPGHIEIRLDSPYDHQAALIVTESWFPGWRAFVDDKPAPLVMANQRFMAIPVSEGAHTVRLEYHSTHFQTGLLLTLLGLVLSAGLIFIYPNRKTRR